MVYDVVWFGGSIAEDFKDRVYVGFGHPPMPGDLPGWDTLGPDLVRQPTRGTGDQLRCLVEAHRAGGHDADAFT